MFNKELSEYIYMFSRVLIVIICNFENFLILIWELRFLVCDDGWVHHIVDGELIGDSFIEIFVWVEFHDETLFCSDHQIRL